MLQTSRPDSTRSLANLDLKPGYKKLGMSAPLDFRGVCGFKKQLNSLLQILTRLFNGVTLAGYVQLRTQGNVAVTFAFNDRGDLSQVFHVPPNGRRHIVEQRV
jgi:hypothetical protein